MKKLFILPILALAFGLLTTAAQADPDVPGSGSACGSSQAIDPAVAGTVAPAEEDWYDASYSTAGSRDLKITPTSVFVPDDPTDVFAWIGASMNFELYEWDKATNSCTKIASTRCGLTACTPAAEITGADDGTLTQPGPGDYQVRVVNHPRVQNTVAYVVNVQE